MTNHRALIYSTLLAAAGVLLIAAPASAQDTTQCQPDDLFCAELRIGPGQGTLRVGPGPAPQPVPPPPPVEPEPPRVYVQPAPQPVQPPPQVYVQPVQPQPMPQPQVIQVQPQQQVMVREQPQERWPDSSLGFNLSLSGVLGRDVGMGGGGVAFRIRPSPWIAVDIGAGVFGGRDYNGLDRVEVPLTATGRLFFNPRQRFQFYGLLSLGGSFSHAEGFNELTGRDVSRDYGHVGGGAGLGVEWRISRVFALNFDVRGFLRYRVDENAEPEFTELTDEGWQSTDLSGGFLGQLGMTFYF